MPSLPEDHEFRQAVADVSPLKPSRRAASSPLKRPPVAAQATRDERAVLDEALNAPFSLEDALECGEELVYLREGMPRQVLRKLRRGHWVVEDHLDLHGMNRSQAAASVAEFLRCCALRRACCVRIVHGKGLGSRNREPVLKGKVHGWLSRHAEVLAFCQAPPAQGGGGAVLVLLKAGR